MSTERESGAVGANAVDAEGPVQPHGGSVQQTQTEDPGGHLPPQVLVEALAAKRIESLDATSVPLWLMVGPVTLALGWLGAHGKRCRRPQQCPDTPGPLRPLLKMRRPAREARAESVHAALWRYPDSTMVEMVREEAGVLHEDLLDAISSAALYEPEALGTRLAELNVEKAQDLAAALWSTGLDEPCARELFCLLPALVEPQRDPTTPAQPVDAPAPPRDSAEKPRHRDKRLALESKVSELEKALSSAREKVRQRSEQLAGTSRILEDREQEVGRMTARIQELESEQVEATKVVRATEAQLRETNRSLKKMSAVANTLRTDLAAVQIDLADAEAERSALMRRLAELQAQLQSVEARLHAVPRGKDAVFDWLEAEERRLRDLEYTLEGGARERVVEEKRLRRKLESAFLEAYPEYKGERPLPTAERRALKFLALGGGLEVGRSAYLIRLGAHDVLVDCGIAVGARDEEEKVPDLSPIERLDALLITHAHTDHVGWIPALVARLEYFPIYCTQPTAELLPVMLRDSRVHYERAMAEARLQQHYTPEPEAVKEAYTRDDIFEAEGRLIEARLDEWRGLGATDLMAGFFPAGHILGAASIVIEGGGRRVVLSGDVSSEHQHTVGTFNVPDWATEPDLLVLESTYGDRSRPPLTVAEDQLIDFVRQTVTKGIAILPSFALGRAQEVLSILKSARGAGRLPHDLKIVADGMINKINPTYIEHAKLDAGDFVEITSQLDRELVIQEAFSGTPTPTVVVTTSGMLTGGPVVEWARRLLPDSRNRMALLGYQDEGAPGGALRRLLRGERPPYPITLRDEHGAAIEVQVAAGVANIALSAHADQDGLVQYAEAVKPKRIVLVHGDEDVRVALRERLLRERVCDHVELSQALTVP